MTSARGISGAPDGAPDPEAGTKTRGSKGSLRAPHRREAQGRRIRARTAVLGYRAGSWILGRLPLGPATRFGGWFARHSRRC